MKSFIEVIKEADETQAKLKFIQDPRSSSKSIANLARSEDLVVRNAAEEELKRRRDSGDQDAAAHVQPPKDPSVHTAQTQVGGEQAQAQEKETKTKEVDPNRIAPIKKGSGRDILNNLNKGKTISGDAPNSIELNPQYIIRADGIKEAAMKSVVFSFGRMNPPTVGHEKLVDKIQAVAKANKADARLFLSRTEGDDKNPLPYSDKLKLAKMAFPGIVQDTPKSMYPAGFIGLLKMLEDKYDKVIIVVGSDRLANIKSLANKYNGSEYKFEEIEVVSAGERDPDEEGVGGMSASKMRAAAKAGDLAKFKSGLPSRLKSAAKLVMDKLKQYLSEDLDEAVLTLSQRLKRRTQMRRVKGKIRLGQRRALARKATSKVISRRSKRVAIKMMRKRILRGRKYQDLSYSSRAAVDRQIARRKTAIARLAKRIEPKLRQAEGRRRSGQGFKSISLSPTPVKKKKLREGMSRDNLIQSVNDIMNRIIAEQNYSLAPLEYASLVRKSNETGVPVKVIKEVYARGVASWNMGLREDTTPQQWGFARVNSFLAGGFNAYTADRDLLEQDNVATHGEEEALAKIADTEDKRSLGAYADRGSTDKVKAAAAKKLEELGGKEPAQQAAAQPAVAGEQPQDSDQAAATVDLNAKSKLTASAAGVITSVIQNNSPNNQQSQPVDGQSDKEAPLSAQEIETAATQGGIDTISKAVERGEELGANLDSEEAYAPFAPAKVKKHQDKLDKINEKLPEIEKKDKDLYERQSRLVKGWNDFINADNFKDRIDAVKFLADNGLIEGHALGKKIYMSDTVGLPDKYFGDGDTILEKMNAVIEAAGIEVPVRGSAADLSGKENEAAVVALLDDSDKNVKEHKKLYDQYQASGGDMEQAKKQNEAAANEIKNDIEQTFGKEATIVSSQQVGGLGSSKLKDLGIDQKTDPTDILVTVKDENGEEHNIKYSMKVYKDVNNITMRNAGSMTFGQNFIGGEIGERLDSLVPELRKKYPYTEDMSEDKIKANKTALRQEYMTAMNKELAEMTKSDEGQGQLLDMWRKIYGCGKNVKVVVTNKKTSEAKIKGDSDYCNPKQPFKVSYDGVKVVVNVDEENGFTTQFDVKTEKDGSMKILARYINKKPKGAKRASPSKEGKAKRAARQDEITKKLKNESFLSFGDFLQESTDKAVGNQPTVNPKPIHHKASGHKYHVHHMVNPNLGMLHQVKHAVDRKDLDIDGDTDEFDKPKAGIPDEIGVGTTPTTKKMFAKYSKELAHIHAGEPVDEQKITPKYTGDENSWYLDASGQKVRVYSQSDLKHPEDVGEFLKNPTPEKDIGPMMSMKDFLKTQPEKKNK